MDRQINSVGAKEKIGDGFGRNYANSLSCSQNRQDEISRVLAS